jgi:hypothetical protein
LAQDIGENGGQIKNIKLGRAGDGKKGAMGHRLQWPAPFQFLQHYFCWNFFGRFLAIIFAE